MSIRKITKIVTILFIITTILSAFGMVLGAEIPDAIKPSNGAEQVSSVAGMVIYVIQIIAFTAAVIMLIFVGIKFVTASPEGKAEVKKIAVIYVVGAILLFAAGGILGIVKNLAGNVNDVGTTTQTTPNT